MLLNCKKENICPDHFPNFNLGSFIIIKSMFILKNLTDFRKNNGGNRCESAPVMDLPSP